MRNEEVLKSIKEINKQITDLESDVFDLKIQLNAEKSDRQRYQANLKELLKYLVRKNF